MQRYICNYVYVNSLFEFFYFLFVVFVVISVVVMFDQSFFNGYMIGEKKDVVYIIMNYLNCI